MTEPKSPQHTNTSDQPTSNSPGGPTNNTIEQRNIHAGNRVYVPIDRLVNRANMRAQHARMEPPSIPQGQLPAKHSLRKYVREVYEQGPIGSCTANAFCTAYRILEQDKSFIPSRLWIYFYERLMEDPTHDIRNLADVGADVISAELYVKHHGVCSERLWPYDTSKYNCLPPPNCALDAAKHKISAHSQISYKSIRAFIAAGIPVLIAIGLYESFETVDRTGRVALPDVANERLLGGHEMCVIGYDNDTKTFEVQNSWGPTWGNHGYCYLPYKYVSSNTLCYEITVIKI